MILERISEPICAPGIFAVYFVTASPEASGSKEDIMVSENNVRGGQALLWALSFALVVMVAWLAASCGSSENGQPTVSWLPEPVTKTVSDLSFASDTVDADDVVNYSSLAIDPDDNNPAIAYFEHCGGPVTQYGRLKYAKYNGSSWDIAIVDDPDEMVGWYPSLAFDGSGNPSIGYYDYTNGALKWAYDEDEDGVWNEDGWPMEVADGENKDYGQYCSHAISGNSVGFAFYEANDGDLIYLQINLTTMQTSMVEPETTNDVGQFCSLHFHGGQPTISYLDATERDLKFAKYNGSTWDVEVVDDGDGDDVGRFSNLDYDYSGNASIAYFNVTDTNPMWARWDDEEEEWDCVTLVNAGGLKWGYHISHQWYSSTVCGFAFEGDYLIGGEPASQLKFVHWVDGDQTVDTADSTYKCGDHCSMAWVKAGDDRGDVWISHRDFDNDYLRYAHGEEE